MKWVRWTLLVTLTIFLPSLSLPAPPEYLRVGLIEGDVQINTDDTREWVPASVNMPLRHRDRIWVPDRSKVELQLRDGTILRLDERTSLDILTLEKGSYQFYLPEGRVYINFKGSMGSVLQMETPGSSVRAYDRALFQMDTLEDRYTDLSVYLGSVYLENGDGKIRVDQDMTLTLRKGFPAELGPLVYLTEWERWNRDRDQRYAEREASSRHLPDELRIYSGDFEEHGKWVYVRDYGYVWTPKIVISTEWAPYRIGRWVWINGDYVWISYEPWGWVPYHYGRWTFVSSFGWCWVPPARGAVYWGPGFVGWVRTPTHISWVPLAPREIYYGYGYYGPYSVNINQVNLNTIKAGRGIYRNVQVRGAVTVLHHDTFIHGRQVEVRGRENPFLREKIHIGRPDIKPEKNSALPVLREIPSATRPPERIRKFSVGEIIERRPLTKEREASVPRPEASPGGMTINRSEGSPAERRIPRSGERTGGRTEERVLEKSKGQTLPEKEMFRPIDRKPDGKTEKPVEEKRIGKGVDLPREIRPPTQKPATPQEPRPQTRIMETPGEKRTLPGTDRLGEGQKPAEREIEKGMGKATPLRERETQTPAEPKASRKEQELQKEGRPIQGVEKTREAPLSERKTERSTETKPQENEGVKSTGRDSGYQKDLSQREVQPDRELKQFPEQNREDRSSGRTRENRSTERQGEKKGVETGR